MNCQIMISVQITAMYIDMHRQIFDVLFMWWIVFAESAAKCFPLCY